MSATTRIAAVIMAFTLCKKYMKAVNRKKIAQVGATCIKKSNSKIYIKHKPLAPFRLYSF